ncbi:hypothetical protein M0805_004547 [Coniferiporia weirii]|nr:hypothetical protein M0805_004547 [Coniferiporia weirii]
MSSDCLSEATIVRCEALSKLDNGIIFIPAVLQALLLAIITVVYWRSGKRKHLWVLADSCAFYTIALLDLLSHLIPEARTNLQVFKIFDFIIGILSFVPILLYAVFLYIFTYTYFLPKLSRLSRAITRNSFLAFIPAIVATNEVGSFLGISYRVLQDAVGQSFLAIGFSKPSDQSDWQIFTDLTLVLLIILQAFVFFYTVYLVISLLRSRRIGRSNSEEYTPPTVGGVIWISVGVKLGAIETALGFVGSEVSVVLARRILRMLSRVCLAAGSLLCERATITRPSGDRRARTVSQIRAMISNPRYSTFARLSPTGMDAHPYTFPSVANNFPPEVEAQTGAEAVTMSLPTPRRVTVHYDGSTAPELAVRFSGLYMPPAEELTAVFHHRGTILATIPQSALPAPASFTTSSMRGMRGHTDLSSGSDTRSLYTTAPVPWPSLESDTAPRGLGDAGGSRVPVLNRRPVTVYSERTNTEFPSESRNKQILVAALREFVAGAGSTGEDNSSSDTTTQRQAPASRDDEHRKPERRRLRRARGSMVPGGNVSADTSSVSTQSGEGADTKRKASQTSLGSARRKAMPIPPPIDASIAGPDVDLVAKVQITATLSPALGEEESKRSTSPNKQRGEVDRGKSVNTSVRDESRRRTVSSGTRMGTPGMTLASSSSRTETDIPTGRYGSVRTGGDSITADPFGSSESYYGEQDYRVSELAEAESGLGRIAARVAQFDSQRRQSYRGVGQPSPSMYSPFAIDRKGKGKARARTSTQLGPESAYTYGRRGSGLMPPDRALIISRPRHLSARTTSSGSSPRTMASGMSPRDSWAPTLENVRHERVTAAWRTPSHSTVAGRTHVHTFSDASYASAASSADALERHAARERELVRIKSVGRVSTRQTPTPSPSSFLVRNSMHAESSDYSISNFAAADSSIAGSPQRLIRPYRRSTDSNSVLGMGSSLRA